MMRRFMTVLVMLILIGLALGGVAVAVVLRQTSFDALIVPNAVGVQTQQDSWQHARISYTLPAPAQGVSRQLDLQLRDAGWTLSSTPTIVASIYDPDPPPRHYFRTLGPNWIHESVFVRSFDSYGANPARVRIVVVRSFSTPPIVRTLMTPFR